MLEELERAGEGAGGLAAAGPGFFLIRCRRAQNFSKSFRRGWIGCKTARHRYPQTLMGEVGGCQMSAHWGPVGGEEGTERGGGGG